ncbi:MAG: cobaltochelatase CobT-related protein [Burkholderiaceae bacterium]
MDGAAGAWAGVRLRQKAARRKILIVISDGCPMDTATHQENDEYYLDQHLRQVVTSVERSSELEICALGVGLDLGCFYTRRLAIDLSSGVDDFLLGEIAKFFTSHRRHHHARHRSPTMPSSQ